MEKRGNFSSFPHYFMYIFLTSGVKLHIHLLNMVVQFIVFLTLSTLICRGTDISKSFSESLAIRDNESRLYLLTCAPNEGSKQPAHPRSLIRVVLVRMKKLCIFWYSKYPQWGFWSDCANAQSGLNLCWEHMSEGSCSDSAIICKSSFINYF